jgi:hypothetical protein
VKTISDIEHGVSVNTQRGKNIEIHKIATNPDGEREKKLEKKPRIRKRKKETDSRMCEVKQKRD